MTPSQHEKGLREIITRLSSAIDEITAARQAGVLGRLRSLLNNPRYRLDLDGQSNVRPTGRNLSRANQIIRLLRPILTTEQYINVIRQFQRVFEKIEQFQNTWFAFILEDFKTKPVYRDIKQESIDRTIRSINPEGFREALEVPILNVLKQHVQRGLGYNDLLAELERGILGVRNRAGDKVIRGYLDNYHWQKRVTRDALFQYSRNYDDVVSEDLGLEWYLYSSGTVEDSRDFCIAREGEYFHINEVLSWAELDWQGRARGTTRENIKTQLGGYNCLHSLRPVSLRLVPEEAIERARRLGFVD